MPRRQRQSSLPCFTCFSRSAHLCPLLSGNANAHGEGLELAPFIPPDGEIEHAVLLFADISGCSKLAHIIGNNGGADMLVQRINSLFCNMVEFV